MRLSRLARLALIPGLLLAAAPAFAQDKPLRDGAVPNADRDDKPNLPEAPPPRSPAATLDRLFERVYDRGPLVVHALRTRMGDTAFFAFIRTWAQQSGPRSLEDFRRAADDATAEDLIDFFAEWLDQTDRPEPTAANGVPGR